MENNVNGGMNGMDNSAAMPNNPMASKMNAGNNLPPMEPVVPNTPVMTTKKKSPIATICLAILAVLGIGFGVYMYMFGCKCPECKECAKCECEECEECEKCEEKELVENTTKNETEPTQNSTQNITNTTDSTTNDTIINITTNNTTVE